MKIGDIKKIGIHRFKSYQALLLAMGIVFGLLVSAQWKSLPTRVTNPVTPVLSLKETRDMLQTEQQELKAEIRSNQSKIADYQRNLKDLSADKTKVDLMETQKALAGLTKLSGPGVVIILNDSDQSTVTEDSIIHAADLRDVVNLLWSSGAEAISLNGERIVYNSSIDCIVNTILVNNSRLSNPFKIEAIGDQRLMSAQIKNQSNLSDLYRRKSGNGLVFSVLPENNLAIGAYTGSFDLKGGNQ